MSQITIEKAFECALKHHRAGRLDSAGQIYRQILAQRPDDADALHFLGVIDHQQGRDELAIQRIRRAIKIRPNFAEAFGNLGSALAGLGRNDDAISAYRQAIALNPNNTSALNNLANVLSDQGQIDDAIDAYRKAIALKPGYADAHSNLATALTDKGKLDEAISACRQAIAIDPRYAAAHYNLGNALYKKGLLDEAADAYRQALHRKPDHAKALTKLATILGDTGHFETAIVAYRDAIALKTDSAELYGGLGYALKEMAKLDEAIEALRRAIALKPAFPEALAHLGMALDEKGQPQEALAAIRAAIDAKPTFAEAYCSLADVLQKNGQTDEAIAAMRQAVALDPQMPEAHSGLGMLLLTQGAFDEGWQEYEWRWKCKEFSGSQHFSQPRWDGGPLHGRNILLHTEQGLGDTLQFVRFLPLVAQRGGKVIIGCPAEVVSLLQTMAPAATRHPAATFEVQCPMLSLPRLLRTMESTIPRDVPYLHADAGDTERWRRRLTAHGATEQSAKVGLIWAGNPAHKNDHNRSIALSSLAPLAKVPGVHFFSLQKGAPSAQAKLPPPGLELIDWTDELNSFKDTASLMANLDLIITVDTSSAHLAGALGRPTWVLLPLVPDWRWMLEREDSPWYPTMRLFRQTRKRDWNEVIDRVVQALALWIKKRTELAGF